LIPWNDCLYRNMYRYKYVVVMDQDEVIVPKSKGTWRDLIKLLEQRSLQKNKKISSTFRFRNVYFMDRMLNSHLKSSADIIAIPKYMHILRHVFRSKIFDKPKQHTKSIHNTDRVVLVHSHLAITCLEGKCNSYFVEPQIAQSQHYRETCQPSIGAKECYVKYKRLTIKDPTVWRYKNLLIERVSTSLLTLGFIDPKKV